MVSSEDWLSKESGKTPRLVPRTIQPAQAIAFLTTLITLVPDDCRDAIYAFVVKASPRIEARLEAWTWTISQIPNAASGRFRGLDRRQRVLNDIRELEGIIRLLRRHNTTNSVIRFFWLMYVVWSDLVQLSASPGAAHVLIEESPSAAGSFRDFGPPVMEQVNLMVAFVYNGLYRELEKAMAAGVTKSSADSRQQVSSAS